MMRRTVVRRLLGLLRPLAGAMYVSASARILNQGLGVVIPVLAAALVAGLASGGEPGGLAALLAGLAVLKGFFRYTEQFTGHGVAFRLLAELRVDTFRKVVPLAPSGLEDERTGDIVSRVVGDIDRVEPFYAHTIAPLASGIIVPAFTAAGLAIWVDPVLALAFAPFPLAIVIAAPWVRMRRVAELSETARSQAGETAALLTDATQGAREVAVFAARETMAARIGESSQAGAELRRRLAGVSAARSGIGDLLAGAAVVVMAVLSSLRFGAGSLDLSAVAAALVASWVGTGPARALEDVVPDLEQALASARRLFDLSDRPAPITPPDEPMQSEGGAVSFLGVGLVFDDAAVPAIEDVTFEIEDGSYVAVVGPSGSGKSTLVELLVRFRDPSMGKVLVGRTDVRRLDPHQLRRQVCLVPQRPEIFFGSIRDNLAMADPVADEARLWDALDRADLGDWVRSLPAGLDTVIGELGETMSGGQRQRLALARAFLRHPRILIVDEATSELDVATEQRVLDQVVGERGRRTTIVVAHRIESVRDADRILVMDRGRLVEQGRHQDLIREDGVYAGLWQRHLDMVDAP